MRNWRQALQSKSAKNIALAFLLADLTGVFVVHERLSQSLPDNLDTGQLPQPQLSQVAYEDGLSRSTPANLAAPTSRVAVSDEKAQFVHIHEAPEVAPTVVIPAVRDVAVAPEHHLQRLAVVSLKKLTPARLDNRTLTSSSRFRSAFSGLVDTANGTVVTTPIVAETTGEQAQLASLASSPPADPSALAASTALPENAAPATAQELPSLSGPNGPADHGVISTPAANDAPTSTGEAIPAPSPSPANLNT